MNNIELAYRDIFYKYPKKCTKLLEENDEKLFKEVKYNDFYQSLANCSTDTGLRSNRGHKIRFSYCSWREAFFTSTDDRNDLDFLIDLYKMSGAMCFMIPNFATSSYDYIISLNRDCYSNIPNEFAITILTYYCELGRCLLDYPLIYLKDNNRDIAKIIDADTAGFKAMLSLNIHSVERFKKQEYLVGARGFRDKHIANCGMMIYGEKNMKIISNVYGCSLQDSLKKIAEQFLKLDSDENAEEDKAREENFKKFLSENL